MIKKLIGTVLFALGYLLSPLCWWNDLIFNLPIAYGFGWLGNLISRDWFLPSSIMGYWLTNLLGIVMMQFGATEFIKDQSKERNLKKDLLMGVASSTVYTIVILGLFKFNILDSSSLLSMINK
jgi:cation transport ATPase